MSKTGGVQELGWRRTSRLGFVVRATMSLRNLLFPAAAMLFGTGAIRGGALWVFPTLALMVLGSVFVSWIVWRHFRYLLGDSDIRVEHGLFNRTARSVPYERIQDISLEQALVPRLFGMVEVKFETGAGGKDEVRIAYVTEAEGAALRETVRALKSGEIAVTGQEVGGVEALPEPEARTLFAMDAKRLTTFGLFEFSLVVFAALGGAAQQFDFLLPFDIWDSKGWLRLFAGQEHWLQELGFAAQVIGVAMAILALAVVGLVTGLGRTVLRDWGFRLEETPKGMRRRRGLLTRTDVVMPLHRVQALKVSTGILRRRFGWHGLSVVSLAQDAKSASHVVVPFATMDEIAPVVDLTGFALPGAQTEWHRGSRRAAVDRALLGAFLPLLGAVLLPMAAPLLPVEARMGLALPIVGLLALAGFLALREHYLWLHLRHAIDRGHLYLRHGWLAPRLDIASRVKLQSVEIAQGPIARRHGYADLKLGVAGGTFEMHGIPLATAQAMRRKVLTSLTKVDFSRLPG